MSVKKAFEEVKKFADPVTVELFNNIQSESALDNAKNGKWPAEYSRHHTEKCQVRLSVIMLAEGDKKAFYDHLGHALAAASGAYDCGNCLDKAFDLKLSESKRLQSL